jgi:rod shape-determining protein MreD
MKLRYLFGFLALILLSVFQTTIAEDFAFGSVPVKPNFLLIAVIMYAFYNGYIKGAICGLTVGILQDLLTGINFGLYTLLGVLIGLGVGYLNKRFYRDSPIFMTLSVFVGTFVYELITGIILNIKAFDFQTILFGMRFVILPESLYNFLIAVIIYGVLRLLRIISAGRIFADGGHRERTIEWRGF